MSIHDLEGLTDYELVSRLKSLLLKQLVLKLEDDPDSSTVTAATSLVKTLAPTLERSIDDVRAEREEKLRIYNTPVRSKRKGKSE